MPYFPKEDTDMQTVLTDTLPAGNRQLDRNAFRGVSAQRNAAERTERENALRYAERARLTPSVDIDITGDETGYDATQDNI